MTTYTITVTDSLGSTANYSFEVVENPTAPAVPDFIEAIELNTRFAIASRLVIADTVTIFSEFAIAGDVATFIPETVEIDSFFAIDSEVVVTGGGGGGESKVIANINTVADLITFVGDDFTWPNGTVVQWSTTGTLPVSDPQVELGVNYLLYQFFDPTYIMYQESDFTEINFFPGGSGTHTLTEQ